MKLKDRDLLILTVLAAALIIFCAYWFGFRNLMSANETMEKEIYSLRNEYNNLYLMQGQLPQFEEDEQKYKEASEDILKSFDANTAQEHLILFVKDIENTVDTWIPQVGLSTTSTIYNFGRNETSSPFATGQYATYTSSNIGCQTTLSMSYQTTYDNFKNLVAFLNSYKNKVTIDAMSMMYNADTDIVSGSITVSAYSILGDERVPIPDNLGFSIYGTDNIFNSSFFQPGQSVDTANGDNIISDYDYFLAMMYSDYSDNTIFGMKTDLSGAGTLSNNANGTVEVYFHVWQNEDSYYVQYSVGDKTFPTVDYEAGSFFASDDAINILIMSSLRESEEDLITASVSIINETDIPVYIKVMGDDAANPRFITDEVSGKVTVYK